MFGDDNAASFISLSPFTVIVRDSLLVFWGGNIADFQSTSVRQMFSIFNIPGSISCPGIASLVLCN